VGLYAAQGALGLLGKGFGLLFVKNAENFQFAYGRTANLAVLQMIGVVVFVINL